MKGYVILAFAALFAIAAAYPQGGWQHQDQGQWGQWGQPQYQSPSDDQQQQNPAGPQQQKPQDHNSKEESGTLNEILSTVGSAVVSVNGSVYYRIKYAQPQAQQPSS